MVFLSEAHRNNPIFMWLEPLSEIMFSFCNIDASFYFKVDLFQRNLLFNSLHMNAIVSLFNTDMSNSRPS